MATIKNKYCPECGANQDRYLSVESAAEVFDLSVGAVRALIKRREVPFYKIGSRVRISFREFASQLVRYPSLREINDDGK